MSAGEGRKPFADPGPAGLMVLAFYLGALWPVATHMASHEQGAVLIALGFGGGLVQLTAGILKLRNGDIMNGNILLAFSAFMWLGFLEWLGKMTGFIPHDTMAVDGWIFLIMGILMCGFTIGHLKAPKVFFWFMVFTDLFFVPGGLFFLTKNPVFWHIAGWDLPLVVISIIWGVLGEILNSVFGKTVIPLGTPYYKPKAQERSEG